MKKNKLFIALFILPCVLTLCIYYLYPLVRTILMSFFSTGTITAPISSWTFKGLSNYIRILQSPDFQRALLNMLKIWVIGGVISVAFALLYAVILTTKIKGKHFFRCMVYLPNVINIIAMGNAWLFYVFNNDFGLLNTVIEFFGGDPIKWLGPDMKFWAMLIATCFSSIGYYMLVFISGIERIPSDLIEAAKIDGATGTQRLLHIIIPLLKGSIKNVLTFWSINSIQSFAWTQVFTPLDTEASTIVPLKYMYELLFGSLQGDGIDVGTGAAVAALVAAIIQVVYFLIDKGLKNDDLEY